MILKLTLPRIEGEDEISDGFNSFYLRLSEKYSETAERIKPSVESTRPTSVNVDFEVEADESIIKVKRYMTVRDGENVRRCEWTDIYDLNYGIFIK